MTDSRTTELLRKLLDERGVEHYDGTESTLWLKDEHGYRASADELSSGRLSVHIWCDTPEQVIAATLGSERGTCHIVKETKTIRSLLHGEVEVTDERCSECRGFMDVGFGVYRNYCPNCGRKVEHEQD